MDSVAYLELRFSENLRIFLGHQQASKLEQIARNLLLKNLANPLGLLFLFGIQNNRSHDTTSAGKDRATQPRFASKVTVAKIHLLRSCLPVQGFFEDVRLDEIIGAIALAVAIPGLQIPRVQEKPTPARRRTDESGQF